MSGAASVGAAAARGAAGADAGVERGGSASRGRDAVRLVALAALLVVCLVRWEGLLLIDPPTWPAVGFALGCAAVAAVLVLAGWRAVALRVRIVATVTAAVVLLAGALLAAGMPLWLLDPRDWDTLATYLGDAVGSLPGVTVPYRGLDAWVRIAIGSGGMLLAAAGAIAAAWPRAGGRSGSLGWSLLAIAVLFAVPAIQRSGEHPWIAGALFALPVCLLVLADRLPVRLAALAAGLVLATVLAAMALAPALDSSRPLIDVQQIASALEPEHPDRFDWSHSYGPLGWPRDGRELLRVRSSRAAYWKAEDLELFDGMRWRSQPSDSSRPVATGLRAHGRWRRELRVTIKGMETRQFIAPGETLSISRAPRQPVGTRAGGFSVAANHDALRRGDAYVAESYVPQPTQEELRASPPSYPGLLAGDLTMLMPPDGTAGRVLLHFAPFGSDASPIASGAGVAPEEGLHVIGASGYAEVYRLAQRLAAGAPTPYDFVRRVERYLSQAPFTYQEDVPNHPLPLVSFLLSDRAGYCQHFSGAMALLVRMGGVPARVSAGFTPGQLDTKRKEYIVRDLDAHSWVEVWFAGIGWVTFDPTPSAAPARSQQAGGALLDSTSIPGGPQPRGRLGGADLGPGGEAAALPSVRGGGGSATTIVLVGAAALLVAGGGWALWRRRGRRASGDGAPADVAELERALRRTGRPIAPGTTLQSLERRFAHSPGARAYVRALTERRYGAGGPGPTASQRRALRQSLAAGLGPLGRLRALWALPPRGLH